MSKGQDTLAFRNLKEPFLGTLADCAHMLASAQAAPWPAQGLDILVSGLCAELCAEDLSSALRDKLCPFPLRLPLFLRQLL